MIILVYNAVDARVGQAWGMWVGESRGEGVGGDG